jgi:phosphoserine aminotransferase
MTNFTPGPSQLYFTVPDHIKAALRENIASLSHRSSAFEKIIIELTTGLRELMGIPSSHSIFFTSSATEIWERSIQNLVEHSAFHFVNGAFSKRYHEIATQLGKKAVAHVVKEGEGFSSTVSIDKEVELMAVTHNETSTGASWPLENIYALRKQNPSALIVVDAVSSLPYPSFDFQQIDSVFFSVQKGFGLPAGLGVWIVNERCLAKADTLLTKGVNIGTYHNLPTLHAFGKKNQTPETPNVLALYLLNKVVGDFLRRGVNTIRKETEYKAAILYQTLQNHALASAFVRDANFQSRTVIVAETGGNTKTIAQALQQKGLYPGDGYGKAKETQLRFANFPAHSKEQYELLVDTLAGMS